MIKGITKSKNLFDVSAAVLGKYINAQGVETTSSTGETCHSDYIGVTPSTYYTIGANKPAYANFTYAIAWYDENKNFISRNSQIAETSAGRYSYSWQAPLNARYLIFNYGDFINFDNETVMLNAGSQPLPYEPYGDIPKDITRIAMKGKQLWDGGVPKYVYADDYKKYNSNNAIALKAGTYTLSSDNKLPIIQAFDANHTQLLVSGTITFPQTYYSLWDGLAIGPTSNAVRAVTITLLSDCILTFAVADNLGTYLMLNLGSTALPYEPYGMQPGWEVRDQQGTILWGADKTLTGTDSISFKGYALPLKSYEIEANMEQAASQAYTIEGTSSIDYQSDGTSISLQIVGNETQTGTPTPTVPIQPEECGERTGNLFDYATQAQNTAAGQHTGTPNAQVYADGTFNTSSSANGWWVSDFIPVSGEYATVSNIGGTTPAICAYDLNKEYIRGVAYETGAAAILGSATIDVHDAAYVRFTFVRSTMGPNAMLNLGSSPLPYEPYGYKIPFSNGNTTYNVYLSEPLRKIGDYGDIVSSDGTVVRRIKKLVLTGTENWLISDGWKKTNTSVFYLNSADIIHISTDYVVFCMSESFEATTRNGLYNGDSDMISRTGTGAITIRISDTIATTDSGFKTWLSDKYSAGHPVEVWYVLANETTEQTTFPTVTPTQGANTLSVSTTLAPSKTRLTATSGVWPKNPIEPEEFGERTRNLLNESALTDGYHLSPQTGLPVENVRRFGLTQSIDVSGIGAITLSFDKVNSNSLQAMYSLLDGDTLKIRQTGCDSGVVIYPSYYGANKLYIAFYDSASSAGTVTTANVKNVMLNLGGTALPYEPYGKYKIPITNSGQTYNIFLNEPLRKIGTYADKVRSDGVVERKVKKLVFDGTELFQSGSATIYFSPYDTGTMLAQAPCTCSHYVYHDGGTSGAPDDSVYTKAGAGVSLWFKTEYGTDTSAFKTYLAQQYSAGHPVEVWYVLNTPTTESITAPEIATTQGANTLAIGTTLTPSKTTIIGHIKELT